MQVARGGHSRAARCASVLDAASGSAYTHYCILSMPVERPRQRQLGRHSSYLDRSHTLSLHPPTSQHVEGPTAFRSASPSLGRHAHSVDLSNKLGVRGLRENVRHQVFFHQRTEGRYSSDRATEVPRYLVQERDQLGVIVGCPLLIPLRLFHVRILDVDVLEEAI